MANGDFTSSFTLPDWSSSLVVVCILASDWIAVWSPDPSSSNESFGAGSRVLPQDSGIVIPKTENERIQLLNYLVQRKIDCLLTGVLRKISVD